MKAILLNLKNIFRWCLMPGIDHMTRRRVRLCKYWAREKRDVLDAGFGNGWVSYLAYRSGARVLGVNMAQDQVQKAKNFYNGWRNIPTEQLEFLRLNLYDLDGLTSSFDEIICYETLEHIKDDLEVCKEFYRLLKLGGVLHLCCPFAEHPRWKKESLDYKEKGGHVRAGYTLESYRALLEPLGFEIMETEGMGGRLLTKIVLMTQLIQSYLGNLCALPVALLGIPFVWFDPVNAHNPYCLYVKAVKSERQRLSCAAS